VYSEKRNANWGVVGKAELKRPLRRTRLRWKENIKQIAELWVVRAWIGLIWVRAGKSGRLL
jgi:hypothetical protein